MVDGEYVDNFSTPMDEPVTVEISAQHNNPYTSSTRKIVLTLLENPTDDGENPAIFTETEAPNSRTATATIDWTPNRDDRGIYTFVFEADGPTGKTTRDLKIRVKSAGSTRTYTLEETEVESDEPVMKECEYSDNNTKSVLYLCLLGIIDAPNNSRNYVGELKNNRFFGDQLISRADFFKIVVNTIYPESDIEKVARMILDNNIWSFPEVDPIAWFAKYIALGKINGLIHGYPDGSFIPWQPVELSESFKMIVNTAASQNEKIKQDYNEVLSGLPENSSWFAGYDELINAYGGFVTPDDVDPGITLSKHMTRQHGADLMYTIIMNAGIQPESKLSELKEELLDIVATE
ncbi:MAG: S-layer homology domain-containing protein [Candidatus Gracilibacteria bacterium]|nr:S-layer homology domain-containing protein [Candidatus Gracilibacteria bacterium]